MEFNGDHMRMRDGGENLYQRPARRRGVYDAGRRVELRGGRPVAQQEPRRTVWDELRALADHESESFTATLIFAIGLVVGMWVTMGFLGYIGVLAL